MTTPFEIVGIPTDNSILIVADHASNTVPANIDLGISQSFLEDHIAYDIGSAAVSREMALRSGYLAILAGYSRLVVDLNRYPDEEAVIPLRSDGVEIPNNLLDLPDRVDRIDRYFKPYHQRVAQLIADIRPSLVVALHSFTPKLRSNPQLERPWDVGVMYNDYETAPRMALQFLEEEQLVVGDQLPYSGKDLNATMNRQAEAIGQPYIGIEIRQDHITEEKGQKRFAEILIRVCNKIQTGLA
ncbi:N-formylglutamate amidohydrolase [Parasphingorhabdus halotolerans]|uniref:N-formylglutamate amidohydrolase n=1 Tax=Parasphingorhabdus halotolerans TaxID=2725558 RepID=A0A6H2DI15_9SPHN|nr:N-formylglutamate amidohydrolase [Parasphingorhabdus halotolerans]QJB68309.1 N-formylglutamate amidohydrolase [Parasphingorhabdus halotolerans]